MTKNDLYKNSIVYFSRILHTVGIYEVHELIIRTVEEDYFVGVSKNDKRAYILPYKELDKTIFANRKEALRLVKINEDNKINISEEKYYEEY